MSEDSVNSEEQRVERMANEIDEDIVKRGEYQLAQNKKGERRDNKKKKIMEQQRQRLEDESEDEALQNRDLMKSDDEAESSENDNDLEE